MEFLEVLVRYEVALWNVIDDELGDRGLKSLGQWFALRVIDRHEGRARVQEISDDIGITVGAASKLVDRLERDGLAARGSNPANRRSSLIGLTPTGRQALIEGSEVVQSALERATGEDDLTPLTTALERLLTRLCRSRGTAV